MKHKKIGITFTVIASLLLIYGLCIKNNYVFISLLPAIFICAIVAIVEMIKYKKSPKEEQRETPKVVRNVEKKVAKNEFDPVMTGQLVALYKTTHNDIYSKEYERRLQHIGFNENEAKNLFMLELMMLKHDSISILNDKKYLTNNYFDLKTVKFPMEASYYAEHQTFLVSEVTKIWDEAEYIWANYRNSEMPKEVLAEIFQISRYGGGELLIKTIEGISKSSSIPKDKILKYSNKEQDLMFKYKWNKEANEPHPYH